MVDDAGTGGGDEGLARDEAPGTGDKGHAGIGGSVAIDEAVTEVEDRPLR